MMIHCCPQCREYQVRRSHRRHFFDLPFRLFGLVPYRCRTCGLRFFRQRLPLQSA